VVDLGLPDGRGETLIADLAKAQPRIWMILATSGDDGAEDRAMAAGADGFLGKPLVNLSVFQATVLSLLPARPAPAAISAPPGDKVRPDPFAYCDDMKHAASILAGLSGPDDLAYVTQFLGGVARTAKDLPLEKAVSGLARVPRSRAKNSAALLQLTCMVDARIAASGPV